MSKAAKPIEAKRKRGGQSLYSDEIAEQILDRMSRGETLLSICRADGMPAAPTVRLWAVKDEPPGFAEKYARAREAQADSIAEQALDIADECEDPQKARIQVDARKWLASKLNPARFADRQQVEHSGPGGGPIEFTFSLDHAGDGDGSETDAS